MVKRKFCFLAVSILIFFNMEESMALELLSPAFKQGKLIPQIYTCDGKDISPPLFWTDTPVGTKSFVLVMDDPDAPMGTWDHWIIYNIPATVTSLTEGATELPQGALLGKNSWNRLGYGGPCPPDREHRYFFKLYALDIVIENQVGMNKKELENVMKGHIIAATELIGKYQR